MFLPSTNKFMYDENERYLLRLLNPYVQMFFLLLNRTKVCLKVASIFLTESSRNTYDACSHFIQVNT